MRVLFSCQPGLGHLHPMLALALALERAGHDVAVATSPSFCSVVERAGLPAVPAGLDWLEAEVERAFPDLIPDPANWDAMQRAWPSVFARAGRVLIPDLVDTLAGGQHDLVVSESLELSAALAAEAAAVPHAVLGIAPSQPPVLMAERLAAAWSGARNALGLPPDPRLERLQPRLYLDTYPLSMRWWPLRAATGVLHPVRPITVELGEGGAPEWLEELPARPTVYVTMGTVFNRVRGLFESIVEALGSEPVQAVVTVGANADPAALGPAPAHVRIERYVPQSLILPRVDVVISHAGHGATLGALDSGVPVLALPMTSDQHANAQRLAAAGAGLVLEPGAPPPRVRAALRTLLGEPLYRLNARRLAREIAAMPPPDAAVPLLERMAGSGVAGPAPS